MRSAVLCVILAIAAIQAVASMPHLRRARDALTETPSTTACASPRNVLGFVYEDPDQYQYDTEAALSKYIASPSNKLCRCGTRRLCYFCFLPVKPRASCEKWSLYTNASGLYRVSPTGGCEFQVYCDMCLSSNEEGWTVIQRRRNEDVAFQDRSWVDYKNGFGNYFTNYWMGLEKIHEITSSGSYKLFVGFSRGLSNNFLYYGIYNGFSVDSEEHKYKMTYASFDSEHSSAADGLSRHKNLQFTTFDADNDDVDNVNCAEHDGKHFGGWWFGHGSDNNFSSNYTACFKANLNGQYYDVSPTSFTPNNGIQWMNAGSVNAVLHRTIMAIRRV